MAERKDIFEKYDFGKNNPTKKYIKIATGTSLVLSLIGVSSSTYYYLKPTPEIIKNYQNMQTTLKTLESETENKRIKRLENLPYQNKEIKNNIDKIIEECSRLKTSPYLDNAVRSTSEDILKLRENPEFIKYKKEYDKNIKKGYISFFGGVSLAAIGIILGIINEMFVSPFKKKKN